MLRAMPASSKPKPKPRSKSKPNPKPRSAPSSSKSAAPAPKAAAAARSAPAAPKLAELSAAEARRIALAAQGLAQPRPSGAIDRGALHAMARRLGAIQLDSVNVLTRSHYLPAWSRLGAYAPDHLDELARSAPRALFEYWGHEASLMPVELQPLFRWRMERAKEKAWGSLRAMRTQRALLDDVRAFIKERGPIGVAELELPEPKKARSGDGWWGWSDGKRALEWLFWSGQLTAAGRRRFERLYDFPERVLPAEVLAAPTPPELEAQRRLVEVSARAMGVATEQDLRDYFRLPLAGARAGVAALVEEGVLERVRVEGWSKPGYLHRDARGALDDDATQIRGDRVALLSPFDSLIWARERTERLFGMRVRLEVYVPAPRRVHGYYVLPFLVGDRLVGRVDLKADRAAGALLVQSAHVEASVPTGEVAAVCAALAAELTGLAAWQGLGAVRASRRGGLAGPLGKALKAATAERAPARRAASPPARRRTS
jgi:hypothetical protein